jgi:hypothetical protein
MVRQAVSVSGEACFAPTRCVVIKTLDYRLFNALSPNPNATLVR